MSDSEPRFLADVTKIQAWFKVRLEARYNYWHDSTVAHACLVPLYMCLRYCRAYRKADRGADDQKHAAGLASGLTCARHSNYSKSHYSVATAVALRTA